MLYLLEKRLKKKEKKKKVKCYLCAHNHLQIKNCFSRVKAIKNWQFIGWEVGGRFKRERMSVHLQLIHAVVWQKPTQHCKAITLQSKKTNKQKPPAVCRERKLKFHILCEVSSLKTGPPKPAEIVLWGSSPLKVYQAHLLTFSGALDPEQFPTLMVIPICHSLWFHSKTSFGFFFFFARGVEIDFWGR